MKTIAVKVIPNARKNLVTQEDNKLKIHVMAPAVDGKANEAVIKMLATHFGVRRNAVRIIQGVKSREKIAEIDV